MTKTRLQAIINAILSIRSILTDEEALSAPGLYAEWRDGVQYDTEKNNRVLYDGTLYKCLQAHTSQPTHNPADAHSLWVRIDDPSVEWPEWRQPTGSTDAYRYLAKVSHNGKHWISILPANVYEPGVYGWDEATEE